MSAPNNILVIRLSSLGDVLMSLPAVKAIKDAFAQTRISWLVEGSVGELLSYQSFIDDVIQFPRASIERAIRKGNLLRATGEFKGFLKKLRGTRYDLVVDFHGIIKSAMLSMFVRGERRVGFGKAFAKEKSHLFYQEKVEAYDKRIHKVERNMLLPKYLGIDGVIPEVTLKIPADVNEYIDNFFSRIGIGTPIFVINPFSSKGSRFKRWGMDRYAGLIKRIKDESRAHVLILWGPGEEGEAEHLRQMAGDGVFLSCPTNIPQLFALLKRVDMYIGGDTGVMHLAAFAHKPVVAIFGPTDVYVNAPYGSPHIIVRRELPCSPCKKKNCHGRKCLEDITVEEVFEAVQRMYKRAGHGGQGIGYSKNGLCQRN